MKEPNPEVVEELLRKVELQETQIPQKPPCTAIDPGLIFIYAEIVKIRKWVNLFGILLIISVVIAIFVACSMI